MVVAISRIILLAVGLLTGLAAQTQEIPPPPNPVQLAADWWKFFIIKEASESDNLDTRVNAALENLAALQATLSDPERQQTIAPLIATVKNGIERYSKLKQQTLPLPAVLAAPAQTYTLARVTELSGQLRKRNNKYSLEAQDLRRLEEAIEAFAKVHSQKKVSYLALKEAAAERLAQGLVLMQSRLQLESAQLELRWRRHQWKQLDAEVKNLKAQIKAASERLSVKAEEIEGWQQLRSQALKSATALKDQIIKAQLITSSAIAATPMEEARILLGMLKLRGLQAEAAIQKLIAARAALAESLIQRVLAENKPGPQPDRAFYKDYQARLEDETNNLQSWQKATNWARSTAQTQLTGEKDTALVNMLNLVQRRAEEVEAQLRKLEDEIVTANTFGELYNDLLRQREGRIGQGVELAKQAAAFSWHGIEQLLNTSLFEIDESPVTSLGLLRVFLILDAGLVGIQAHSPHPAATLRKARHSQSEFGLHAGQSTALFCSDYRYHHRPLIDRNRLYQIRAIC